MHTWATTEGFFGFSGARARATAAIECVRNREMAHHARVRVSYRDGLAVRLLPVQYPLSQGESVQAGEPVAAASFAISADPLASAAAPAPAAAAVWTRVEAGRVLGQGRRRHLPRQLLAAQHRAAAAVEEGRVAAAGAVGETDAATAAGRRDAGRRRCGRRRGRRRRGRRLDAVALRAGRGAVLALRRRHVSAWCTCSDAPRADWKPPRGFRERSKPSTPREQETSRGCSRFRKVSLEPRLRPRTCSGRVLRELYDGTKKQERRARSRERTRWDNCTITRET